MSDLNTFSTATKRLSRGRGNPSARVAAVQTVRESLNDRSIVRALLVGLWDDDADVRAACGETLAEAFDEGDFGTRTIILDRLLARLASGTEPTSDTDGIPTHEAVTLLNRVVYRVSRDRDRYPALFSRLLVEIERTRGDGVYGRNVRRTLQGVCWTGINDTSDSARRIERFESRRSLEQLRGAASSPSEVKQAARSLGKTSLEETSLQTLLSHLLPLFTFPVQNDNTLHSRVLSNIVLWSDAFPNEDLTDIAAGVESLKAYRSAGRDNVGGLPPAVRNEAGFTAVGVDALADALDRFRDDSSSNNVVTSLLAVLAASSGVRPHANMLVDVARESDGSIREEAIDVLCGFLMAPTEAAPNDPLFQSVFDDETETANEIVREFVVETASSPEVSEDEALRLVEALLRSHPDALDSLLPEVIDAWEAGDPITERGLNTLEDEALVGATGFLVRKFDALERSDPETAVRLVKTLAHLGNNAAVSRLERAAVGVSGSVSTCARQSLVDAEFYETIRESDTRQSASTTAAQCEELLTEVRSLVQKRRKKRYEHARTKGRFEELVFEANERLREGQFNAVEHRIDGLGTLCELKVANLRAGHVVQQAASTHEAVSAYLGQMAVGEQLGDGLWAEVTVIDDQLAALERLVGSVTDCVKLLDAHLDTLDRASDDGDERLREIRCSALSDLRTRHHEAQQRWENRLASLSTRYDRLRRQFEDAEPDGLPTVVSVDDATRELQSSWGQVETLTGTRESERAQVEETLRATKRDLSELDGELQNTAEALESLQSDIDQNVRESERLVAKRRVLAQRVREDEAAHERIVPRMREARRRHYEQTDERARFHEYRRVFDDYLRRRYETQLTIAFAPESADYGTVESVRAELDGRR